MPPLILRRRQRPSLLSWLVAIICAVSAIAVITTGILVLVIYLIYQPKMPHLRVASSHLNKLDYDRYGRLGIEMAVTIIAENHNVRAHTSFSDTSFALSFHGLDIAVLKAGPFEVPKNSSFPLNYLVASSPIPLDEGGMGAVDVALRQDRVPFNLKGQARTRWRVGKLLSVKLRTHLSCQIDFFTSNGSSIGSDCSS